MATVAETLKATGFTDEQIAALDPKLVTTFTTILTTAESEKTAAAQAAAKAEADRLAWEKTKADAELLQRANSEFYEQKIVPGLTSWQEEQVKLQTETANAKALAAFYREQNEAARTAGFVPTDAPTYTPPVANPANPTPVRGADGKFVTPGTPTFTLEQIDQRLGNGISNVGWAMQEYQRLTGGQFLPDSFDKLSEEATAQKLPFRDYVARKYSFAEKQQAIIQRQQQEQFAKERADERTKADAEWKAKMDAREAEITAKDKLRAEQNGSNPDTKLPPGSAKFADLQRATKAGERPDPTKMTAKERHEATLNNIHKAIEEREALVQ